jgi:anti-sigma B factor antagonist
MAWGRGDAIASFAGNAGESGAWGADRQPPPPPFAVVAQAGDGRSTVTVTGEVDLATSPELERHLELHAAARSLLVDLTGVSFLDSSGMAVLVRAARRSARTGQELSLRPPTDDGVLRALEIAGLLAALPFHAPT